MPHRQLPAIELRCQHEHPDFPGVRCDHFLGYGIGFVVFVGFSERAPVDPDGELWYRCPRCRLWNHWRLVPATEVGLRPNGHMAAGLEGD